MSIQDDEILGKAYDAQLMRRIVKYLRPYKWQVVLAIALALAVSGLEAVRPYFTKIAVDEYIANGDKIGLLWLTIAFFALLVIRGVVQYYNAYITQKIGQYTIFDIRMELFAHLQKLSLKFYDKNPIGRLITRVTNDVSAE